MRITENSCEEYGTILASKASVPGGGGAVGIVGGFGVALAAMAANVTAVKKKYVHLVPELTAIVAELDECRSEAMALSQKDGDVFGEVVKSYRLPSATEAEKAAKCRAVAAGSKKAAEVPLALLKCCLKAMNIAKTLANKADPLVLSDVACGLILLYSAMEGALPTVYININAVDDEDYRQKILAETDVLMAEAKTIKEEVVDKGIIPALRG